MFGNESTGYNHIIVRHSLTSRKPYWDSNGEIDNPSKFRLGLAPIQYLKVASQIFKKENKNHIKNKSPEQFDVYIGMYHHSGINAEYKLITYKDTGIIHSLFIIDNKKPFNKKKIINLKQGWSSGFHDLKNCLQIFEIPYLDFYNIQRYKVIIRHSEIHQIEKWYIQVNSTKGEPLLTTAIKQEKRKNRINISFRTIEVDFVEITEVEKIIKKIMEDNYDFWSKSAPNIGG